MVALEFSLVIMFSCSFDTRRNVAPDRETDVAALPFYSLSTHGLILIFIFFPNRGAGPLGHIIE